MLIQSTIDAVRDLAVKDVVGHYLELKKRGANYIALSPFTDEKTPSFTVFPRNNNFKCFSSGNQGDAISFVMLYKNLEFIEAVKEIASDHHIPIDYENLSPEEKEKRQKEIEKKKEVLKLLEWAKHYFLNNKIPATWKQQRFFNDEKLAPFQVGYGSGLTPLHNDAIKAGLSTELLKKAGLARMEKKASETSDKAVWSMVDTFQDRVVFPILDARGNCVAFTGRYNGDNLEAPKYWNSPDAIWEKRKNLYGLYQASKTIRKVDKAYLVEGPTDVIRMFAWDLTNTVCPCGSELTDEQCKLLFRYTDRVTIVPDNDLEKEDNPGLKALERNAKKLLAHGFFVRVLIPGTSKSKKSTDPDSFLGKMRTEDQFIKWMDREEGYIEDYLCRVAMTMAEGSAEDKFKAVKLMAGTLECVKETGYRNALYDNIASTWPYFKKEYKLEKRGSSITVSTDVENLKREAREEYFKNKFIEEDGKYIAWGKGGVKQELSDFTMKVIFTVTFIVDHEPMRKAVISLRNDFNYKTLAVISTDDFCSSITFKKIIRRRGEFYWYGKDGNLDDVAKKVFHNTPNAVELDRMGWNTKHKFWVWSNGIYFDQKFHPMDKYGLIQRESPIKSIDQFLKLSNGSQLIIQGKLERINNAGEYLAELGEAEMNRYIDQERISKVDFFYLPFGNALQIDTGEDDKGNNFKKDIFLVIPEENGRWTFDEWAAKIAELYGKNGWVMIAYYLASLFRDIIYKYNNGWFPLLYFFGRPETGKSTAAKSIYQMFGEPPQKDGINLSSGSTFIAMGRYMDTLSNVPGLFNEYKNHVHEKIKEILKGLADGSGRLQGTKSARGTTSITPKSGALICGQELPSSEKALMTRIIPLEFLEKDRVEKQIFDAFKAVEQKGYFRWITCKISEYRHIFDHYTEVEPYVYQSINEKCEKANLKATDRLLLNASSLLVPLKLFMEHSPVRFPFGFDDFEDNMLEVMKMSSAIQAESDEVDRFFTTLMSVVGQTHGGIIEGKDFMIKNTGERKLLYLRFKVCYSKYEKMAHNPMGFPDLNRYIQSHKSFIEATKNARFGSKSKTSAFVFDYDFLLEHDIDLQHPKILSNEELTNIEAGKEDTFAKFMYSLKKETLYETSWVLDQLAKKLDDHILKDELESMCDKFNERGNIIRIQKHDNEFTQMYVEATGQTDVPF